MSTKATGRMRLRSIVLLTVVGIVSLPSCLLGGQCSDHELRLAEAIPHFDGAQPEFSDDPEGTGCVASLQVEAEADEVVDHYRRVLEEDDWDVSVENVATEGLEGMTVVDLNARRGEAEVTISLEEFEGQVSAAIRVSE